MFELTPILQNSHDRKAMTQTGDSGTPVEGVAIRSKSNNVKEMLRRPYVCCLLSPRASLSRPGPNMWITQGVYRYNLE